MHIGNIFLVAIDTRQRRDETCTKHVISCYNMLLCEKKIKYMFNMFISRDGFCRSRRCGVFEYLQSQGTGTPLDSKRVTREFPESSQRIHVL